MDELRQLEQWGDRGHTVSIQYLQMRIDGIARSQWVCVIGPYTSGSVIISFDKRATGCDPDPHLAIRQALDMAHTMFGALYQAVRP